MSTHHHPPCAAQRQRDGAHPTLRMAPVALDDPGIRWEQENTLSRARSE
ncbi:MAG: hypothetical protein AAF098_18910 [Pseudomonadota bacterium]